jgi:zinc transporter ZupT
MLLAASAIALLIGPLLFQLTRAGSRALGFFEGFAFITIVGLLCFGMLPQAIGTGGALAWFFAGLGLLFPVALEKLFHHLARQVHLLILLIGVAGLAMHAAIDGVALSMEGISIADQGTAWWKTGHRESGDYLALAVVFHRFPLGLAVWYLLAPTLGKRFALYVLAVLIIATLIGYSFGSVLIGASSGVGIAYFQAFVAGSILHVVIYEPGHHKHSTTDPGQNLEKWPDRIGLVLGLVLLYVYL